MIRDSRYETPTVRKVLESVVDVPSDLPERASNKFLGEMFDQGRLVFAGISREDVVQLAESLDGGDLIRAVNEQLRPDMVQASADIENLPADAIWVLTQHAYLADNGNRVERALKRRKSDHFHHLHYRQNLRAVARRARDEAWKGVDPDRLDALLRDGGSFSRFVEEGRVWLYGLHKTAVLERPLEEKAPVGYEWMMGKSPVRITYDRIFKAMQFLAAHLRTDFPEVELEVITKDYADAIRGAVESMGKRESKRWFPRLRNLVTADSRQENRYAVALLFEAVDNCPDNAFLEDLHRQYRHGICFPCYHSLALYLKRLLVPEKDQPKVTMNVLALPTEDMADEAYKFVERGFVLDGNAGRHIASDFLFAKLYGLFLGRHQDSYDQLQWHFRKEDFQRYMLKGR